MTLKKIYSMMDHERMRWRTLDYRRLILRLSKITKEEKLYCFLILATETGDQRLFTAGILRATELGYNMDIRKIENVARETKMIKALAPAYKYAVDVSVDKQIEKVISNVPKFAAAEEKKFKKPEDRYLSLFNKEELKRAIII